MRFLVIVLAAISLAQAARAESAPPTLDEIVARLIERTDDPALTKMRGSFSYQRVSRVDYLDENGDLERQAVRLYRIAPENGQPVSKLLSINGQPPKDKEEKNKSPARETGEKSRKLKLDADLLSRFDYTFKGEDRFMGRRMWLLEFRPKENAPEDSFSDKVVNAMTGTIFVDAEDYQMAKADVHLSRRLSFFGGLAGAIERMELHVIQKRVAPSVWLSEALTLDFTGRKLFSAVRLKAFENCTDFHRVPPDRLGFAH